ncbi:MAG: hypothetical protein AAFN77_02025 [Planctomycetota bacterium]
MSSFGSSAADQPPWKTAAGSQWLSAFQSWRSMRRLIQGTLNLDPNEHAHEIRAAASMVIMFCRDGLWPPSEQDDATPVIELAARQLSHVKQLYETKGRIQPKLQSSKSYRKLLKSLDEEIRILEARIADSSPKMPNVPPCTWGDFWV